MILTAIKDRRIRILNRGFLFGLSKTVLLAVISQTLLEAFFPIFHFMPLLPAAPAAMDRPCNLGGSTEMFEPSPRTQLANLLHEYRAR
jgi:hypothetical protein